MKSKSRQVATQEVYIYVLSTGNETGLVSPQAKKSLLSAVVRVRWKGVYDGAAGLLRTARRSRARLALTGVIDPGLPYLGLTLPP